MEVKALTIQDVREAQYFAIICDSTQNVNRTDQILCSSIVLTENRSVQAKNDFFTERAVEITLLFRYRMNSEKKFR